MKNLSKYLVLGVAFFIVSFAITVQVRITNDSTSTASQEKVATKLKDEIFELSNGNEKLGKKLDTLDKSLESIRNKASENDSSNVDKSNLIKKYTIFCSKTDVKGQGMTIKYYPNEYRANGDKVNNSDITKDLIDIVNELKNAGAEAISINNYRFGNNSSIEMEKNNIVIDGEKIKAPFTIKAIGNSETMNSSLIRPGGTIDLIKIDRAKIELIISKEVKIPKSINM